MQSCYFPILFLSGVRCFLRGKAHVEWKITRGGERRTVKEDQYFIDEKSVVWGKGGQVSFSNCIVALIFSRKQGIASQLR